MRLFLKIVSFQFTGNMSLQEIARNRLGAQPTVTQLAKAPLERVLLVITRLIC